MADISTITASNGTTYNIKDATARDSISRYVKASSIDHVHFGLTGSGYPFIAFYTGTTARMQLVFTASGLQLISVDSSGTQTVVWSK